MIARLWSNAFVIVVESFFSTPSVVVPNASAWLLVACIACNTSKPHRPFDHRSLHHQKAIASVFLLVMAILPLSCISLCCLNTNLSQNGYRKKEFIVIIIGIVIVSDIDIVIVIGIVIAFVFVVLSKTRCLILQTRIKLY